MFLYNLSIYVLAGLYRIVSIFNAKASLFVKGRKDLFARLAAALAHDDRKLVWVHCASLGEFEQGRPVIEALKEKFPSVRILLTFFSPSGYEVRKNYKGADYVFYLPWDTAHNAKEFIRIAKPALAIFIKYEFWYNYSDQLKKNNVHVISVSSIFRPDQVFFKGYGSAFRKILHNFDYFFVQNPESKKLLQSINITNVEVVGDTRFDRVMQIINSAEEIEKANQFKGGQKLFVIGSCWPEDMEVLAPFINENSYQLKFIIAPHEISEDFLSAIENSLQVKFTRFSNTTDNIDDCSVLIVDNIGMLSRLYRYGEFAYVGGAFGKGLHNILEAACYGIPIFFGNKNYKKFKEANDLIMRGGAFEVGDYSQLKTQYEMMISRPENFLLACEVTRSYVEENLGATQKIIKYCTKLL